MGERSIGHGPPPNGEGFVLGVWEPPNGERDRGIMWRPWDLHYRLYRFDHYVGGHGPLLHLRTRCLT